MNPGFVIFRPYYVYIRPGPYGTNPVFLQLPKLYCKIQNYQIITHGNLEQ